MAESYTDWERADEILAVDKPADASRLGEKVRIRTMNCITSEVLTSRHDYDTPAWWTQAPNAMLEALKAKSFDNEELTNRLLATSARPLARATKYDRRWGICCTLRHGVEWFRLSGQGTGRAS